ncbi:hypothetical protein LAC81_34100 [Ensifer adhaerens]|uniref:hypothetical protein n=1 Tax=Ensifer adhaerens TaxID=106592 RepID=UPI001CBCB95B|nr:hypothetical protein [Ensifer adhaerens]UAX95090.1 hypothetical protein LAC78_29730 [Ensifer adhaerens]UAY03018.1 hypothetical protein LAC80_30575 [Ensifer adhaerens]UAY11003.1 hypothetical protein LAC81_34100 [Ensifer adhaerens]
MSRLRERMARWIERRLPQPRLREEATGRPRQPVKRIIVFGRIPNPTFDYYLAARLEAPDMPPYQVADIRGRETPPVDADGAFVIICRYASPSILRWIESNAERLSGVGLFLDDDIPAVVTGRDADFFYRLFLWYRALWPLSRLNRHLDIVWASTPHLASRLKEAKATVLPPAPPKSLWLSANDDVETLDPANREVLIAYHATAVHLEEHRFLRPIIAEVLRERPQVRFEVFADRRARGIWQGLERVQIREPMPWTEYLADASHRRIDIMLVPLAPTHVNDSRAPTKRIDVARFRAAGVFSDGLAYGSSNDRGELRMRYAVDDWCRTVVQLVDDLKLRRRVAVATHRAVLQMTSSADTGLEVFKQRQA